MTPYLYAHENPSAPQRSNGKQFWGYPDRQGATVQIIGVHTAENLPDMEPPDLGAENVARYFASTSRAASAHENVDSDSFVTCLPDEATAFAARGWNQKGWHIELCTRAHAWSSLPEPYKAALLERAAKRCALRAVKFGIPVVRLSLADAQAGKKGFVAHADLDPSRRSDPGPDFPWDHFLSRVSHYVSPAKESKVSTSRISGPSRYHTAAEVAKHFFTPEATDTVLLARGDTGGIDAIAAAQGSAPVLLVSDTLPSVTAETIEYLAPRRVIAVGGPNAVSQAVLDAAAHAAERGRR